MIQGQEKVRQASNSVQWSSKSETGTSESETGTSESETGTETDLLELTEDVCVVGGDPRRLQHGDPELKG